MTQITQYQPFATALNNQEESLLDVLFKNSLKSNFRFRNLEQNFSTGYPVDIYYENLNSDQAATLNFEFALPGVEPSDVEITRTKDGELRVKFDREVTQTNRDYYARAISRRKFDLVWKIPKRFSLERMDAKFKNGLLTITIPKSEDSIPETVKITVSE